MPEIGKRWLAVVNRHAGNGKTAQIWRQAKAILDDAGIVHEDMFTAGKYHATEIAYRAASKGDRRFIVAGGDGTIHEVLEGIMKYVEETDTLGLNPVSPEYFSLAAIPVGSGNDWIKIHGINYDIKETVRLIKEGSFTEQDVVKVSMTDENGTVLKVSYMINIAGIGFDANVCARVNERKDSGKRGKLIYVASLLYNLFHYKATPMRILCDGVPVMEGDCLSIAIGTGKFSGGGMRQTPEAVYDDGLMDYTIIPAFPIARILYEAPKLFTGKLLSIKELIHGRCKTVTISPLGQTKDLVEVDGEITGENPVRFETLPMKINVLHTASKQ